MEKLCTDSLLKLIAIPFVELSQRYGRDVGSQGASLINMFWAACEAELSDQLKVDAKQKLIRRSLVVATFEECSVSRGRILESIHVKIDDQDPYLLMRTMDGMDFKFNDFSIWFACTSCKSIILNERNLDMLKRDAVLGDLMSQNGRLLQWPKKNRRRKDVLSFAIEQFEIGLEYSEREVNEIINAFFDDHALLRRELIVAGLLKRTSDGGKYWR